MADIFVSYAQKDRTWVKRLVGALTAEGYDVWWDLMIRAGESFDELIESTLEKVSCVVGVWLQHSVRSEWVRAESAWAKDRGIFVSVRIDEARLPLKFYHVHTASMADWSGDRDDPLFHRLVADIAQIAGPPASPASAPSLASPTAAIRDTDAAPEPAAAPKQEIPSPKRREYAAPKTVQFAPEPGSVSTAPLPRSKSRRGAIVVGIISLTAAALAGGF